MDGWGGGHGTHRDEWIQYTLGIRRADFSVWEAKVSGESPKTSAAG